MTGHIRRRGKSSWEIKFELPADATGKRQTRYHTVRGTKRDAEAQIVKLQSQVFEGRYIEASRASLQSFLETWCADWASVNVSAKTCESYKQLLEHHVYGRIGTKPIQKLRPADLANLYASLAKNGRAARSKGGEVTGLSARSIGLIHRVLHRALGHATRWGAIGSNPATLVDPPRPEETEIEILSETQVRDVLGKLAGREIGSIAALGLATGLRRGEILALRWKDVDLDRAKMNVQQSVEQTKAGLRFKSPKTKHGRRVLALPAVIVDMLRALRVREGEQRLALGLGKIEPETLVFHRPDGSPLNPNSVSTEWRRLVKALRLPKVSLHAWRHTHASQLIASGMDVLTISRRLGHATPSITLNVYGHLFSSTDDRAAAIFDAAFRDVVGNP